MKIVAIMLVRNEDQFVGQALENILDFCDKIIVADHDSQDDTASIIRAIQKKDKKVQYHKINKSGESHDLVEEYIDTDTWIFGVDGDEVYDPEGLCTFREKLLAGEYIDSWQIFGNVLHCSSIDLRNREATGYLSPPSRSMTKLYNFRAIKTWEGSTFTEPLLGGEITFHDSYNAGMRLSLLHDYDWDSSFFRCLHTCFMRRSSLDKQQTNGVYLRPNPVEVNNRSPRDYLFAAMRFLTRSEIFVSKWKRDKYMRGQQITKDISDFYPGQRDESHLRVGQCDNEITFLEDSY